MVAVDGPCHLANFAPLLGEVASGGDVDEAMATARSIIDELAAS